MKRLYALVVGLLSWSSYAYIYHAKVLRAWDTRTQQYHYFIGLGDFHDHAHYSALSQRTTLEALLTKCDKQTTKMIIEDLSSPGVHGRLACGRFFLGPKGGILSGLAQHCRQCGLDVDNVEYRFCRVIGLGPVMNSARTQQSLCPMGSQTTQQTTITMLAHEVDDLIHEIRSYNDGNELNQYYTRCVQDIEAQCNQMHFKQHPHMSIADYVMTHTNEKNRVGQLNYLFTFDSGLLDAKMVHTVVNSRDKKTVVAIAGGTHINAVCGLLEKIGYERVYEAKHEDVREYNLRNCLGSNIIEGQFCVRPQPADIEFLRGYL